MTYQIYAKSLTIICFIIVKRKHNLPILSLPKKLKANIYVKYLILLFRNDNNFMYMIVIILIHNPQTLSYLLPSGHPHLLY